MSVNAPLIFSKTATAVTVAVEFVRMNAGYFITSLAIVWSCMFDVPS